MTAAAQLRQDMAEGIETARRRLPADPVKRARMVAERIAGITGGQSEVVTCWMCLADRDPGDVRPDGFLFACIDQDICAERAAVNEDDEAELDEEFEFEAARGRGDCGEI